MLNTCLEPGSANYDKDYAKSLLADYWQKFVSYNPALDERFFNKETAKNFLNFVCRHDVYPFVEEKYDPRSEKFIDSVEFFSFDYFAQHIIYAWEVSAELLSLRNKF